MKRSVSVQKVPYRITCAALLHFITQEVEQKFEDIHNLRDFKARGRTLHHAEGEAPHLPHGLDAEQTAGVHATIRAGRDLWPKR